MFTSFLKAFYPRDFVKANAKSRCVICQRRLSAAYFRQHPKICCEHPCLGLRAKLETLSDGVVRVEIHHYYPATKRRRRARKVPPQTPCNGITELAGEENQAHRVVTVDNTLFELAPTTGARENASTVVDRLQEETEPPVNYATKPRLHRM